VAKRGNNRGGSPFRQMLDAIPDEIAKLADAGVELEFVSPVPPAEHVVELMRALGVSVVVDPLCYLGPAVRVKRL
jgi:hypothetical protein